MKVWVEKPDNSRILLEVFFVSIFVIESKISKGLRGSIGRSFGNGRPKQ